MQCSAFTGDKQFTNEQISNIKFHLCPNFLCKVYPSSLPNLARCRTGKFLVFHQQSLGMIQTCVPMFLKSPYSLGDKIRTTVQLITYTVPQNCLSLFTIHHNSHPKLSVLAQRVSFRFFFLFS